MTDYQSKIVEAVRARGYRDGWTDEQFAARQVAKLVEEVGELARSVSFGPVSWKTCLSHAAQLAREQFDGKDGWIFAWVDPTRAPNELADVLVVVYNLADALGVDINELALGKAEADIERGVR